MEKKTVLPAKKSPHSQSLISFFKKKLQKSVRRIKKILYICNLKLVKKTVLMSFNEKI
jgi:hypothetical protein